MPKKAGIRSAAAPPSRAQWWTLPTRAMRPPSRPSTTQNSHSGRDAVEAALGHLGDEGGQLVLVAGGVEHGAVHVVLDGVVGSSTHTGWCSWNGTSVTTRRNALISGTRAAMWSRIFSNE